MRYLPDTNIFIRASKGYSPEAEFLSRIIKKRQIVISTIVIGEFLAKTNKGEEKYFYDILSEFEIAAIDTKVAIIAAEYRRESLKNKRVHLLDCFLAAQAKLNGLVLVTNNKSDFPMKDIKVINP